jgi:L-fucose mutarotase
MLRYRLTHPEIAFALASAGHGAKVLVTDANYPVSTSTSSSSRIVHLNLRPHLPKVTDVVEVLADAITIERVVFMQPDAGGEPTTLPALRGLVPEGTPFDPLPRQAFYAAARDDAVVLSVVTSEMAPYGNVLLTVGVRDGSEQPE